MRLQQIQATGLPLTQERVNRLELGNPQNGKRKTIAQDLLNRGIFLTGTRKANQDVMALFGVNGNLICRAEKLKELGLMARKQIDNQSIGCQGL